MGASHTMAQFLFAKVFRSIIGSVASYNTVSWLLNILLGRHTARTKGLTRHGGKNAFRYATTVAEEREKRFMGPLVGA